MAKKATKVRQVTLTFNLEEPVDEAMHGWLVATAEKYKIKLQTLVRACMAAGREAGEKKAAERYQQLTGADAGLLSEFKTEAAAIAKERQAAVDKARAQKARRESILAAREKAAADPSGFSEPATFVKGNVTSDNGSITCERE